MIEKVNNHGIQRHNFLKSGYANVNIQTKPDFFAMTLDGKEYVVENPEYLQNIKNFLSSGEAERKETVAAVLHKGITPTKENLELIHRALNEDVFQQGSEATAKEELDAELIESLNLPDEVKEKISSSKDLVKSIKLLLSEKFHISSKELEHLNLRELISLFVGKFKGSSVINIDTNPMLKNRSLNKEDFSAQDLLKNAEMIADAQGGPEDTLLHFSDKKFSDKKVDAYLETEKNSMTNDSKRKDFEDGVAFGDIVRLVDSKDGGAAVKNAAPDVGIMRSNPSPSFSADISQHDFSGKGGVDFSHEKRDTLFTESPILSSSDSEGRREVNAGERSTEQMRTGAKSSEASVSASDDIDDKKSEVWNIEDMVNQALLMMDANLEQIFAELEFKKFLVEKIDLRMIEAKKEFEDMKTFVVQSLDKGSISKAIEMLTKSIQKSSFAMITDMQTEKKLLISLSRLEEAALALKNKDFTYAEKIVKEVRETVGEIEFKPSSRKIQAMVFQKAQSTERALQEKEVGIHEKIVEAIKLHSSGTARDLLELVRFTGINHEIEKYENSSGVGNLRNLKELFSDSSFSAMMGGEQMLNHSDDQRRRDFYVLDIPLQIHDEVEGLKVFVGGRSDENRLDWRNAELYFAIKVNDDKIGLRFSIKDGGVSIETVGEREFRFEHLKESLSEIGYRLLSVRHSMTSDRKLPVQMTADVSGIVREMPEGKFDAKI